MENVNKDLLKMLLGLTGLGTLVDGYLTMITLLHLFREANLLAFVFAVVGGVFDLTTPCCTGSRHRSNYRPHSRTGG